MSSYIILYHVISDNVISYHIIISYYVMLPHIRTDFEPLTRTLLAGPSQTYIPCMASLQYVSPKSTLFLTKASLPCLLTIVNVIVHAHQGCRLHACRMRPGLQQIL